MPQDPDKRKVSQSAYRERKREELRRRSEEIRSKRGTLYNQARKEKRAKDPQWHAKELEAKRKYRETHPDKRSESRKLDSAYKRLLESQKNAANADLKGVMSQPT